MRERTNLTSRWSFLCGGFPNKHSICSQHSKHSKHSQLNKMYSKCMQTTNKNIIYEKIAKTSVDCRFNSFYMLLRSEYQKANLQSLVASQSFFVILPRLFLLLVLLFIILCADIWFGCSITIFVFRSHKPFHNVWIKRKLKQFPFMIFMDFWQLMTKGRFNEISLLIRCCLRPSSNIGYILGILTHNEKSFFL